MKTTYSSAAHGSSGQTEARVEIARPDFDHLLQAARILRVLRVDDLQLFRFNSLRRRYWGLADSERALVYDAGQFRRVMHELAEAGDKQAARIARVLADESMTVHGPLHCDNRRKYVWHDADAPPAHMLPPAHQVAGGMPL